MVRVEFKKLYEDAILPKKAHLTDAGFDLYAYTNNADVVLELTEQTLIKVGVAMALPNGFEAQVRPRSGLALKNGISIVNSPGTIDSSWRGEIGVILINFGKEAFTIKHGMRIAQMVIQKLPEVEVIEVKELTEPKERGQAGFGSTGV